ncbi:ROK family glucokinase [Lentibacillus cibarius]|uniref:Glucokinase n=1 Tax=Lentibacillus cibarius TaxID=2583219 RepID=A0A5S3QGM8_9BACI|nr:ROK family glucokinase [Lentibacillus cibarius]TMN20967.1 ROK family glucokinase [Lentibacillus cibarius]
MMANLLIAVDIGGTSIKLGMVDQNGNILNKWSILTNDESNAILSDVWESIYKKIVELNISKKNILGIGVGVPGFIDSESGYVYQTVNINWRNVPLVKQLEELSGLPVFAENDANLAVLGENWKGAGNQAKNLIAVTLGTGVGGGVISNGSILSGTNGTAGEIGHMTVEPEGHPCNCGRRGCLETIASATGIVRQAMEKMDSNDETPLTLHYRKYQQVTAKDIFELSEEGDELCSEIIRHTASVLGLCLANTALVVNPAKILIGGGVAQAGETFIRQINVSFQQYALGRISNACEIKQAQLGNDAGIIGAAFLVKQKRKD